MGLSAGIPQYSAYDLADDYGTGLASDGPGSLANIIPYALVVFRTPVYRADANPGQTLTITINKNGTPSASIVVATNGAVTTPGFPLSCAKGDRITTNLTGTANVTGISYTIPGEVISQ